MTFLNFTPYFVKNNYNNVFCYLYSIVMIFLKDMLCCSIKIMEYYTFKKKSKLI